MRVCPNQLSVNKNSLYIYMIYSWNINTQSVFGGSYVSVGNLQTKYKSTQGVVDLFGYGGQEI